VQERDINGAWVDAPQLDPRHDAGYLNAVRGGTDKECLAAANAVDQIGRFIDNGLLVFNSLGLANAAIGISFLFMPSVTVLAAAALAISALMLVIGETVIRSAFDDDAYAALVCILSCEADENGMWDAAALERVQAKIVASPDIDSAASDIVNNILDYLWGEVGLSNAGTMTHVTVYDCSECDCGWCYKFDFALGEQGWGIVSDATWGAKGTYNGAAFVSRSNMGTSGAWATHLHINRGVGTDTTITSVEIECSGAWGRDDDNIARVQVRMTDTPIYTINDPTAIENIAWDGLLTGQAYMNIDCLLGYDGFPPPMSDPGGNMTITSVTLRGTGGNPFGADNCIP
jgi:hypothetical protein